MRRFPRPVLLAPLLGLLLCSVLAAAPPRSLDDRLTIELVAEHPTLVTPTGIDVDGQGRAWVIESNTHFPPEGYDRHPSDRLLIFSNAAGDDGKTPKVFADGFTHAMSVAVRPAWIDPVQPWSKDRQASVAKPARTQVFLATRREILLLEDLDGDDVCDTQTRLAWLETEGNYPHNGLAGFAFDAMGWMYFGFGENLGADYKLSCRASKNNENGGEEVTLSGGGEGGNMYRMWPDGSHLSQWATGFWNPHASCVDAFGRLFTVDNDPDSRPPCRLLHVIEGGDYGYRFRNGRKGLHPFTSWNGEIPGTLPMVSGTGEAPSGILAYEHDAFPEEYLGNLIVTSWGDHRIDRFRLRPKGASFESVPEPLIIGDETFRPVGIALAPDGSLYCTDWVQRDYKVHGQGRLWRIRATVSTSSKVTSSGLASARLVERRAAAQALKNSAEGCQQLRTIVLDRTLSTRERIEASWAFATADSKLAGQPLLEAASNLRNLVDHFDEVTEAVALLTDAPTISFLQDERNVNPPPKLPWGSSRETPSLLGPQRELLASIHMTPAALRMKSVGVNLSGVTWLVALSQEDPFCLTAAINGLARSEMNLSAAKLPDDRDVTVIGWALLHRRMQAKDEDEVRSLLAHRSSRVRQLAVQWAAEERFTDLRPQVEAVLKSEPMTTSLFLATLAALEMLDGKAPKDFDQTPPGKYVLPLLKDDSTPDAVKVQALRLVDPRDPGLSADLLTSLLGSDTIDLKLEVLRTLAGSSHPEAAAMLAEAANSSRGNADARRIQATAITGLAAHLDQPVAKEVLVKMLTDGGVERRDVIRSLRELAGSDPEVKRQILNSVSIRTGQPGTWQEIDAQLQLLPGGAAIGAEKFPIVNPQPRPATDEEWIAMLTEEKADDPAASGLSTLDALLSGEQVFYHPNGPGCFKCHTVNGRGGRIGPDLSRIGGALSREQLLTAILKPSQDVSPQFTNWTMALTDGRLVTGMLVHENSGDSTLGNDKGELMTVKTTDIEARTPVRTSVMPEKLEDRMTVSEFRELLAFLGGLK